MTHTAAGHRPQLSTSHMDDYSDIINLKHPEPVHRQRMSMQTRAAQFAPFAALTGHGAAIAETARMTDSEAELSEGDKALLDEQMRRLMDVIDEHPQTAITYFLPDPRKQGGSYKTLIGMVRKIDEYTQIVTMDDGTKIDMRHIHDIIII